MRIAIDMQGALTDGSRPRGIGRYTSNLVSAMARLCGADLHLMLNDNFHRAAVATRTDIQAVDPAVSTSFYRVPTATEFNARQGSTRRVIAESIARRHVANLAPDVLLATSLFENAPPDYRPIDLSQFPVRLTATILYDLIPLVFKDTYLTDPVASRAYRESVETLKSADLLLAISKSAKRDAVRFLNISPDRIAVIGAAVDGTFEPAYVTQEAEAGLKGRFGLARDFIVYVAGADFRKNLEGAIEAVAAMPDESRRSLQILLVTNADPAYRDRLTDLAAEAGLAADALVFAHKVSDRDLVALYCISQALVFPSLYEGFGLPVLEAMQCGTPVVVADTSSLPEIVDRADLLYDPERPEQAGEILHRLVTDPAYRMEVSDWGIARGGAFSWDRSARLALEAIDRALDRRSSVPAAVLRNRLLDLDGARREIADALRLDPAEDGYVPSFVSDLLFSVPRFQEGGRRLLIDATMCAQTDMWTGIQRVVRKLTASFYRGVRERPEVIPVAIRLDMTVPEAATGHIALSIGEVDIPASYEVEVRPGDDLFMLDSTWDNYGTQKPLFTRVREVGGRIYTCVYDLIPELHPEVCVASMPAIHAAWLHDAVAESDGLLCISRAVADELLTYIVDRGLKHRPDLRVGWFHCGSDLDGYHSVNPVRDDVRAALSDGVPAFLAVGTLEPRKCHSLALDAFEMLWDRGADVRLVFIGGRGWKIDALAERIRAHPEHGSRLFWFESASDNDVSHAYESAAAVVSMSMAEGFGLPLAESARLGKGVICSDIPVFREVGGEGAVYFKSGSPESMAEAIEDWLAGRRKTDPSKVSRTTWAEAARRISDTIYGGEWYRTLP